MLMLTFANITELLNITDLLCAFVPNDEHPIKSHIKASIRGLRFVKVNAGEVSLFWRCLFCWFLLVG